MYVPAHPMPVRARETSADQKPSAKNAKSKCPRTVVATPARYTRLASTRSVSVTRIGTARI